MRKLLLSLVLSSAALTTAAHADTFSFVGTTKNGALGYGSITTNSSGTINGGQIDFLGSAAPIGTFNFVSATYYLSFPVATLSSNSSNAILSLYLQNPSLNATSDPICTGDNCKYVVPVADKLSFGSVTSSVGSDFFTSGALTLQAPAVIDVPTAATPEPSSLILLGTGALGMAGAVRRRFIARA